MFIFFKKYSSCKSVEKLTIDILPHACFEIEGKGKRGRGEGICPFRF